ncbi:MAG: hydroxymethylpyrimidine/phosphomethylpyrimidine kinase [Candidatus Acididesulfobacter guangdongensis]|uniref:hydroxymethylpyrimidine kinase n=1 Tax=Acididesulfobacter guangdongensis TaxID=2597225 RepID=A0A519BHN0_ACIG2|nr:MAG: hydroxymethylpyrimidine/phosphomethylpyrimidine kinase [Candidatus Acididesulfobacter guangdongensis]
MKKILSVAGYDGSGGAGITSDAKIFSKLNILGLSAISVLTAQNPDNIYKITAVDDDFFDYELKAIFDYFKIDSVKIGLIGSERQSVVLAGYIKKYNVKDVILDPVFVSTSGVRLGDTGAGGSRNKSGFNGGNFDAGYLEHLLNIATVITPNINEAEIISGLEIKNLDCMKDAAAAIKKQYRRIKNIIIKGSHLRGSHSQYGGITIDDADYNNENRCINNAVRSGYCAGDEEITDLLLTESNEFASYKKRRIITDKQIHGTGCAFSAMMAALLTKGINPYDALNKTEIFVEKLINNCKTIPDNSENKKIYITANI